jgi:hypothetical protein
MSPSLSQPFKAKAGKSKNNGIALHLDNGHGDAIDADFEKY